MKISSDEFKKLTSNIPVGWTLTTLNGKTYYTLHNEVYKRLFIMNLWHDIFSKRFLGQKYVSIKSIYDDFMDSPILISNTGELMYVPTYYNVLDRLYRNRFLSFDTKVPSMSIILFVFIISMISILIAIVLISKSRNVNVRELLLV